MSKDPYTPLEARAEGILAVLNWKARYPIKLVSQDSEE